MTTPTVRIADLPAAQALGQDTDVLIRDPDASEGDRVARASLALLSGALPERPRNAAFSGFSDNTSGVTISTQGQYVRMPSPWAEGAPAVADGFDIEDGDITCTDATPRRYKITANCYLDDGQNATVKVRIAVNGVGCVLCASIVSIPSQERPAGQMTQTMTTLVAGDVITLQGTRTDSTGALILEDASITITET
jgi:hypothetical protein